MAFPMSAVASLLTLCTSWSSLIILPIRPSQPKDGSKQAPAPKEDGTQQAQQHMSTSEQKPKNESTGVCGVKTKHRYRHTATVQPWSLFAAAAGSKHSRGRARAALCQYENNAAHDNSLSLDFLTCW